MSLNHSITLAFMLRFSYVFGDCEALAKLATLGFRLMEVFGVSAGCRGDPARHCFVPRSQQGQINACEDT